MSNIVKDIYFIQHLKKYQCITETKCYDLSYYNIFHHLRTFFLVIPELFHDSEALDRKKALSSYLPALDSLECAISGPS